MPSAMSNPYVQIKGMELASLKKLIIQDTVQVIDMLTKLMIALALAAKCLNSVVATVSDDGYKMPQIRNMPNVVITIMRIFFS
jgi:hypothetical protein